LVASEGDGSGGLHRHSVLQRQRVRHAT